MEAEHGKLKVSEISIKIKILVGKLKYVENNMKIPSTIKLLNILLIIQLLARMDIFQNIL